MILDYIFVRYFNWSVKGAAIATVIAQVVCCILMLILFAKTDECFQFGIIDFEANVILPCEYDEIIKEKHYGKEESRGGSRSAGQSAQQ